MVFGEVVFGGSASLLDLFLRFLAKCFFCNLYVGVSQPDRALTPLSRIESESDYRFQMSI